MRQQRRPERHRIVRVHRLRRLAPEEVADALAHQRHPALAADEQDLGDVGLLEPARGEDLFADFQRPLDEVGRAFSVTRERIRQIENQSLKKLRALAETGSLKDVA